MSWPGGASASDEFPKTEADGGGPGGDGGRSPGGGSWLNSFSFDVTPSSEVKHKKNTIRQKKDKLTLKFERVFLPLKFLLSPQGGALSN